MTATVSRVRLFDVARGQPAPAQLMDSITERQLADWEGEWMPELFRAMQRLSRAGVERRHWPQSRHWDWRRKVEALQEMLAYPGFSIVCDGLTQGMMIVDTMTKRGRIGGQKGQHLVYVHYIENAPWNRKELFDRPRYRGVGSILIGAAVALSDGSGFHGRIGLHSLPQANGFYADKCGMTDLGADADYDGLHYFEMTPGQARSFIAKGGEIA